MAGRSRLRVASRDDLLVDGLELTLRHPLRKQVEMTRRFGRLTIRLELNPPQETQISDMNTLLSLIT